MIVILGSPNSAGGKLYSAARGRCELALMEYARRVRRALQHDRARYVFEREFADTDVQIEFSVSATDEATCGFDLASQKSMNGKHWRN